MEMDAAKVSCETSVERTISKLNAKRFSDELQRRNDSFSLSDGQV